MNGVYSFPNGISPKVNVIARLEFELACCDSAVQYISHNGREFTPHHHHHQIDTTMVNRQK